MEDKNNKKNKRKLSPKTKMILFACELVVFVLLVGILVMQRSGEKGSVLNSVKSKDAQASAEGSLMAAEDLEEADTIESFEPTCTKETDPSNLITETSIQVDGEILDDVSDYQPEEEITFGSGSEYTQMDGVITFRGNNFRSSPSYGTAELTSHTLKAVWTQETGSTYYNGKSWNGSGWTGQPLITTWSREMRQHMNMYDWAKTQEELTEVIYATLDGHVYFIELSTGKATRDPLNIGFTFKGSGSLDPRGYPILYLGSGYNSAKGKSRVFIVNLLSGEIMYTFGNEDSFANRQCYFFDSSALVDAETDTLIYPGEDGVLYLLHLNTSFDEENMTLSIDPDRMTEWKYSTERNSSAKYWYGMEDSAVTYGGYLFIADNGGDLMCLDLNTLQLVWAQDVLDDTNGTPVMSVENGHLYIYIGPSFHLGWRSRSTAEVPLFKVDAEDGTIVWQTKYECSSVEDVSGGIQSTIALGKNQLSNCVFTTVSRTGGASKGVLACISKETGAIVWEHQAGYAWSSPVCVYNQAGEGTVIYCSSDGNMYMLNGLTGDVYSSLKLSSGVIESSPAVYNDMAVVGIRANKIYGIQLQ